MCKVHPTCNPASPPTTLKPPPTTLPRHTYDPSRSHLRPSNPLVGSVPTTHKPPPTTLPGHTYNSEIRTWKEMKRASRRMDKIAQRWKNEKTQTQVNRVFRLTMHSACKTKIICTQRTTLLRYAVESKRRQANCTMTEVRTRLCLNLRQKKTFLQAAAEKDIEFSAMHRTCHS